MKSSVFWMFIILVGCRLSQATQSLSICNCNDRLETVCVAANSTVQVHCPKLDAEDVMFNLIKNDEVISKHACNGTNNTLTCISKISSGIVVNKGNRTSFTLTVMNANSHGMYKCEGKAVYPPPIKKESSPLKILVLVEGHQCLGKTAEVCTGHAALDTIWIVAFAFLCAYSLIASVIAVVNWVKLRRTDSYSDYMNTKPRPSKERKRKRGIQTPTPRYF